MSAKVKAVLSFIGAFATAFLISRFLEGRSSPLIVGALAAWIMLMVGYPATKFVTGSNRLSFAAWATASGIGALFSLILFLLLHKLGVI